MIFSRRNFRMFIPIVGVVFMGLLLSVFTFFYVFEAEEEHNQGAFQYRAEHHAANVVYGFSQLTEHARHARNLIENEMVVEINDKLDAAEFNLVAQYIISVSIVEDVIWVDQLGESEPRIGHQLLQAKSPLQEFSKSSDGWIAWQAQMLALRTHKKPSVWLQKTESSYDVYYATPLVEKANHKLRGSVVLRFPIDLFLRQASLNLSGSGQSVECLAKYTGETSRVYFDAGSERSYANIFQREFNHEVALPVADQSWTLRYSATPDFFITHPLHRIWDVIIFGILSTLLASLVLWYQLRKHYETQDVMGAALKESENLYQQMVQDMPVGIVLHKDGIIQYLNPFFLGMVGEKNVKTLIGKSIVQYVHPDERDIVSGHIALSMQGKGTDSVPVIYKTPKGARKSYETLASYTQAVIGGEPIGVIIVLDVTEQNKANRELKVQYKTMQAILSNSPVGIWMRDADRNLQFVNPAYVHLVGCSEELLLHSGNNYAILGQELAEQCKASDEECLSVHTTYSSQVSFTASDEKVHTHEVIKVPLYDDNILIGIVGFSMDITARLEAEAEREKVQKQAEEAQRLESLGVLTGGIAHDFNNLLAVILGNATLVTGHLETASKEHVFITRIQQASKKAADLCRQMLVYAGKGHFVVKHVNLSDMVYDMTSLMEVALFKDVQVEYTFADDLDLIEVDVAQVQQLIMNLITNANEAMKDSGGIVHVRTGVMEVDGTVDNMVGDHDVKAGKYIFIEVEDHGCGMDDETKHKIFEPFFTTKFTGRGLGMSAMLGTVRSHDGTIQLDSKMGEGTVFRVLFPALGKEDLLIHQTEEVSLTTYRKAQVGKILLVDDEEIVLETIQVMLEELGYESLCAEDGLQAVEIYKQHQDEICLVLMDMTMPKMSGKACTQAIREINPDVKIILSSGYTEEDISKQFQDLNLTGIVQKPFDLDQLRTALVRSLGFY